MANKLLEENSLEILGGAFQRPPFQRPHQQSLLIKGGPLLIKTNQMDGTQTYLRIRPKLTFPPRTKEGRRERGGEEGRDSLPSSCWGPPGVTNRSGEITITITITMPLGRTTHLLASVLVLVLGEQSLNGERIAKEQMGIVLRRIPLLV